MASRCVAYFCVQSNDPNSGFCRASFDSNSSCPAHLLSHFYPWPNQHPIPHSHPLGRRASSQLNASSRHFDRRRSADDKPARWLSTARERDSHTPDNTKWHVNPYAPPYGRSNFFRRLSPTPHEWRRVSSPICEYLHPDSYLHHQPNPYPK